MAQTETIQVLDIRVEGAVKNVKDLKDNIKALKQQLNEFDKDLNDQENMDVFKDKLEQLKLNQNALKDAMYATSGSFEDVIKSAQSANVVLDKDNKLVDQSTFSYNNLVNTMANLKREWRATTDEAKRNTLSTQINAINDALKSLDSSVGVTSRNVGNYKSAMVGLHDVVKDMPSNLNFVKGSLDDLDKSMGMVSKNKILGIVFLLAPVINKIAESLKENDTALEAIKKVMASMQPLFDLMATAVETLAGWFSKAVDYVVELMGESGETFKNIISGAVGVGNAIVQLLISPVKQTIEAFKGLGNVVKDIFKGDFSALKTDASNAIKGINDAFNKGFSFKENFALGKKVGEEFVDGLVSSKDGIKDAVKDAVATGMEEGAKEGYTMADFEKALALANKRFENDLAARNEALKIFDEQYKEEYASLTEEIDAMSKALTESLLEDMNRQQEEQERVAEARVATLQGLTSATSSILNSLADIYESEGENNKKAAKKAKAIRIATATIDTISGAVSAFASYQKQGIPQPYATILGAAQAAVVTATGMAQIAKIKSTNVDGSSTASASSGVSASVSAPSVDTRVAQVRNVTTASEEERLNSMASDQRVVLVMSDLETKQNQVKVQTEESSF